MVENWGTKVLCLWISVSLDPTEQFTTLQKVWSFLKSHESCSCAHSFQPPLTTTSKATSLCLNIEHCQPWAWCCFCSDPLALLLLSRAGHYPTGLLLSESYFNFSASYCQSVSLSSTTAYAKSCFSNVSATQCHIIFFKTYSLFCNEFVL
jgi:hypothetical protein